MHGATSLENNFEILKSAYGSAFEIKQPKNIHFLQSFCICPQNYIHETDKNFLLHFVQQK